MRPDLPALQKLNKLHLQKKLTESATKVAAGGGGCLGGDRLVDDSAVENIEYV